MASTALTEEALNQFTPIIDAILFASDLSTVSVKSVRNGLQSQLGYDITAQKKAINALITQRFDQSLAAKEASTQAASPSSREPTTSPSPSTKPDADADPAPSSDADEADDDTAVHSAKPTPGTTPTPPHKLKRSASTLSEDARLAAELHAQWNSGRPTRHKKKTPNKPPPKKKSKKSDVTVQSDSEAGGGGAATPAKKKRKANPNNPFNTPLMLSDALASFLGEARLSRPETVKRIWQYVKERDLQDPGDRRYILCDDSMRPIFGDKIHMFTMNKVLKQNMYKAEEKV